MADSDKEREDDILDEGDDFEDEGDDFEEEDDAEADEDLEEDVDDDADDADDDADDEDDDAEGEDDDADADAGEDEADADDDELEEGGAEHAAAMARVLGVDDDDEDAEEAEEGDKEARTNRAERRRQRAMRRRAKQGKRAKSSDESPRDRNKRRREALLKRRRRAIEEEDDEDVPEGLQASEMVEDALARGGDSALKWVQRNWSVVQWVLVAGVAGAIGFTVYTYYNDEAAASASDALARGVVTEQALVIPADKDTRKEEDKKNDPRTIYATAKERDDIAMEAYKKVASEHSGSGAAILAKLGEGNQLLDRQQWDDAKAAFDSVLASELAPADIDVRGRALEGKGFAQEGKGELDGALKTFEEMAGVGPDTFKYLAQYHQARVHVAKKQVDKAKEVLKAAREEVGKAKLRANSSSTTSNTHPFRWLEGAIDEELRALDPSLVPTKLPPGMQGMPGGGLSPQDIQRMLKEKGLNPGIPGR